jgi:hypothetical protein
MNRRVATALVVSAALLLSGCVALIESLTVSQDGPGGLVRVVATLCPLKIGPPDVCDPVNNFAGGAGSQWVVVYLVPDGFTAREVRATGPRDITLNENPSLTEVMQVTQPPPAGKHWVGFTSGTLPDAEPGHDRGDLVALFEPPAAHGGDPVSTFTYKLVSGGRITTATCTNDDPFTDSACMPPYFAEFSPLTGVVVDSQQAIRDIALRADGAQPSGEQGSRADVPFTARYAGATPSGDILYNGTTTIPGGVVQPGSFNVASTGEKVIPVKVDIPDSVAPGVYAVKLTLDLVGDEIRELTRQITVREKPPAQPPQQQQQQAPPVTTQSTAPQPISLDALRRALARIRFLSTRRTSIRGSGLRFEQTFPVAGSATWTLTRSTAGGRAAQSSRLARLTTRVTRSGKRTVRLRLTRAGKRTLRPKRRHRLKLTTVFTDSLGRKVTVPVTFRTK